ncbi:hypothetical protein M0813_07233 [Anaeramoeba flamelloides]|uniref:Uncharacterized protein n=1 Tax=Anaeramoeba flamelloides TaxID=1746091 RepID=A0AAV7Z2H3_9EUKA|nr:hypothetical protein M0812_19799 [Anaeramoeba flamelloides]KAJ6230012.1 hypothetical protein M0813_07233 [Anaeramoeba flamelloides]|eukprot:Anaeramoba_flamelloidesc34639_g1_i2.p1 GENE.c34639_g1_i2~~c34639_g1_i2.p1  ORF type:complete len:106 (+),score=26.49 c34639_g1_i2:25-318(+)
MSEEQLKKTIKDLTNRLIILESRLRTTVVTENINKELETNKDQILERALNKLDTEERIEIETQLQEKNRLQERVTELEELKKKTDYRIEHMKNYLKN